MEVTKLSSCALLIISQGCDISRVLLATKINCDAFSRISDIKGYAYNLIKKREEGGGKLQVGKVI